jgi:hypothetical protein
MTLFDEGTLKGALNDAANGFEVSDTGAERILEQARDTALRVKPGKVESLVLRFGRTQSLAMAVAASVVVLGVAVPLFLTEQPGSHAPIFSALQNAGKIVVHGQDSPLPPRLTGTGDVLSVIPKGSASYSAPSTSQTGTSTSATTSAQSVTSSSLRVEEIGTVDVSVAANRFQSTLTKLASFATTDGGYVSSTQAHMGTKKSGTYSSGTIVLAVPEHRFAQLVNQVRHAGHTTSVVTSANDVTGQYVDLQARIAALQLSRSQYLKIMSRTNSISGILSVQSQLNSIQSQIEQLQGQLNLLTGETTYGTLTVSLAQAGHVTTPPSQARTGFNKAWHDSITGFVSGFEWLLRIAGPLLFALILLGALLALGHLGWRASQRRRS